MQGEARAFFSTSAAALPPRSGVIVGATGPWYVDATTGAVARVRVQPSAVAPRSPMRAPREDEVVATITIGAEDTIEADLAGGAERGGDVAVWQAADNGECVTFGGNDGAAFEHAAQAFNVGRGPVGKIAQCALTNLAAFAVALAQQDRRWRVPIRNSFDIHDGA